MALTIRDIDAEIVGWMIMQSNIHQKMLLLSTSSLILIGTALSFDLNIYGIHDPHLIIQRPQFDYQFFLDNPHTIVMYGIAIGGLRVFMKRVSNIIDRQELIDMGCIDKV